VAHVVESLLCRLEAPNLKPSPTKKKKKERERRNMEETNRIPRPPESRTVDKKVKGRASLLVHKCPLTNYIHALFNKSKT
jgi:hypothetical protein